MHFPWDLHFLLRKKSSPSPNWAHSGKLGTFQRPGIFGKQNLLHLWTPAHPSVAWQWQAIISVSPYKTDVREWYYDLHSFLTVIIMCWPSKGLYRSSFNPVEILISCFWEHCFGVDCCNTLILKQLWKEPSMGVRRNAVGDGGCLHGEHGDQVCECRAQEGSAEHLTCPN